MCIWSFCQSNFEVVTDTLTEKQTKRHNGNTVVLLTQQCCLSSFAVFHQMLPPQIFPHWDLALRILRPGVLRKGGPAHLFGCKPEVFDECPIWNDKLVPTWVPILSFSLFVCFSVTKLSKRIDIVTNIRVYLTSPLEEHRKPSKALEKFDKTDPMTVTISKISFCFC